MQIPVGGSAVPGGVTHAISPVHSDVRRHQPRRGDDRAAYASLLGASYLPYLLAAAFMSAPGGILMAKMIMPDDPADTDGGN